jgi:hypothetical protein
MPREHVMKRPSCRDTGKALLAGSESLLTVMLR